MLSLAALMSDRATVTVKYRGHDFKVVFRPSDYTAELDRANVITFLAGLVDSWDLTEDGVPIPTDAASIDAKVPVPVMHAIRKAIQVEVLTSPEA